MSESVVPFLTEVPTYEVRDGVMYITAVGWSVAMHLRTFKRGAARAEKAIRAYEDRRAEVLGFRKEFDSKVWRLP